MSKSLTECSNVRLLNIPFILLTFLRTGGHFLHFIKIGSKCFYHLKYMILRSFRYGAFTTPMFFVQCPVHAVFKAHINLKINKTGNLCMLPGHIWTIWFKPIPAWTGLWQQNLSFFGAFSAPTILIFDVFKPLK